MEHKGRRFSFVYLERAAPARDSQRWRNRLAAYYWEYLHANYQERIRQGLEREAGIEVPYAQRWGYRVDDLFREGELRDVLDAVTIVYQALGGGGSYSADRWKSFVERSLQEENVGYSLDEQGGVHYFVDEEFERNRASALAVLEQSRYGGVRAALKDAYRHIDSDPADTKASVRSVFEALEILVKQIVETKNLNKWIVENTLKTRCLMLYQDDPVGGKVVGGLFDSLALWVDALHNYRHGQPGEEPVTPDESLCVHIISAGSSYIRWLARLDDQLHAVPDEA
jgi:hypothetical protein